MEKIYKVRGIMVVMLDISEETKRRIEEGLASWDDPNSEARKRFESGKEYWDRVFAPLEQTIYESERLHPRDYIAFRNI